MLAAYCILCVFLYDNGLTQSTIGNNNHNVLLDLRTISDRCAHIVFSAYFALSTVYCAPSNVQYEL